MNKYVHIHMISRHHMTIPLEYWERRIEVTIAGKTMLAVPSMYDYNTALINPDNIEIVTMERNFKDYREELRGE